MYVCECVCLSVQLCVIPHDLTVQLKEYTMQLSLPRALNVPASLVLLPSMGAAILMLQGGSGQLPVCL